MAIANPSTQTATIDRTAPIIIAVCTRPGVVSAACGGGGNGEGVAIGFAVTDLATGSGLTVDTLPMPAGLAGCEPIDVTSGLVKAGVFGLIVSLAGNYDAIVSPSTTSGKNVMPRVAALLVLLGLCVAAPWVTGQAVTTGVIGLRSGSQVGIDRTASQCVARWY